MWTPVRSPVAPSSRTAGALLGALVMPAESRGQGLLERRIPKSGEALPAVGLGTWQVFDVAGDADGAGAGQGDAPRLRRGRRADHRQLADVRLLRAVTGQLAAELGVRPRLFVATKVWTSGKQAGIRQMEDSMRKLRVERLDLMQVHNLVDAQTHLATLRDWKAAGRVRYLGITHYHAGAHGDLEQLVAEGRHRLRAGELLAGRAGGGAAAARRRRGGGHRGDRQPALRGGRDVPPGARTAPLPEWAKEAGARAGRSSSSSGSWPTPRSPASIPGTRNPRARGRQSGRAVGAAAGRRAAPADGRALQLAVGGNPGGVMPRNEAGRYRHIEVQPVAGALGAEIRGVNVAAALDDAVIAEIRQAWLDHLVIFFRGPEAHPARAARVRAALRRADGVSAAQGPARVPAVTPVVKLEHERVNFGGVWHSDTTYLERPPMASMLYAVEMPPYGGDTLFANQYLAYETLSDRLQRAARRADRRQHLDQGRSLEDARGPAARSGRGAEGADGEHPVVRTHPGDRAQGALRQRRPHERASRAWTEEESAPLLEYLFQHQVRPELTCRFQWQPGSLAFWDNRCVQHNPVNDYHGSSASCTA